eukprot:1182617-Pleurochrysis_carterae.AAC.1
MRNQRAEVASFTAGKGSALARKGNQHPCTHHSTARVSHHLVEEDAQRPVVDRLPMALLEDDFGRQVLWRAAAAATCNTRARARFRMLTTQRCTHAHAASERAYPHATQKRTFACRHEPKLQPRPGHGMEREASRASQAEKSSGAQSPGAVLDQLGKAKVCQLQSACTRGARQVSSQPSVIIEEAERVRGTIKAQA